MEIEAQYVLQADRAVVWAMLNDTEVLLDCIPGCEQLEAHSENRMNAVVVAKVGPIKARFSGEVELTELNPPESYAIVGEGKGGVAGFANGRADVSLEEVAGGTLLKYKVTVQIGGKLAQLGSRLISSTAKKLSEQFFGRFAEKVAAASRTG